MGGGEAQGGAGEEILHGVGELVTELVAPLGFEFVEFPARHDLPKLAIRGDAETRVLHEIARQESGRGAGQGLHHERLRLHQEISAQADINRTRDTAALHAVDALLEHLAIHVESDSGDVTALLGAEEIARAADLQIAQGDFESAAETGVLLDRIHPFARIARCHGIPGKQQIGVGLRAAAADATPELIEVRETETIRAIDDDGVGVGNIDTAFDDGRADEHVGFAIDKLVHHILKQFLIHLAVADDDPCFRAKRADAAGDVLDGDHAVVQKEDLAAALDLGIDGLLDDALVIRTDLRLHRLLVRRWSLDGAHVTHAHQGQVKRARNRRGTEGEHIDEPEDLLELLFVLHAEALLFIDHHEAEILEAHIL